MTNKPVALEPCPCCQSTDLVPPPAHWPEGCVYCRDCGLRANSPDAWNTRPDSEHVALEPTKAMWRVDSAVELMGEALARLGGRLQQVGFIHCDRNPTTDANAAAYEAVGKAWDKLTAEIARSQRAEQPTHPESEPLVKALERVLDACDQGIVTPAGGPCGMSIDAQIRASVYNRVPAWPVEEAREALAQHREGRP